MGPGTFLTRLGLVKSIFSGAGDKREPALWQWHVAMAMSGARPPEIQAGWWQAVCWSFCSVWCCSAGTDVSRWQEQKASVCRTGVLQWWQHSGFGIQLPSDCTEGAPQSTPFGLMLSPHISLLQFHLLHEKCCGGGHFRAVTGMQTYGEVVLHHIIHKKNCIFPDLSVNSVCAEHKEASESMTFCI